MKKIFKAVSALFFIFMLMGLADANAQDSAQINIMTAEANQGNVEAQVNLGMVYQFGLSTEKNNNEALKWYHKAAGNGDALAKSFIEKKIISNVKGIYQSFNYSQQQINLLKRGADRGDVIAQSRIGMAYFFADGIDKDYESAKKWLIKAAKNGNAEAQYVLSIYYQMDKTIDGDAEAVMWLRKAAEQGLTEAQFHLAGAYRNGVGVAASDKEAIKWLRKAATQDTEAREELENYYSREAEPR